MGARLREYLTRRRSGGGGRAIRPTNARNRFIEGAFISDADIDNVLGRIAAVLVTVDDVKEKRKILRKGTRPVVDAARNKLQPYRGEPRGGVLQGAASATYSTPKLISSIRAPKGKGIITARFYPGNLEKSIRVLSFRKSPRIFAGPRVRKNLKDKEVGKTVRSASGFYAQMLFGSARAFQKKIMIPALNQAKGRALQVIEEEVRKRVEKQASKEGL